ncbi:DUF937 domain-containing protein [Hyphomicrobium sp. MC1]|uniref:DUF937 domain-containing protein n=1 Tax=Hyphomicrobium sp. (strain MC1) TaxID=717785 RepID=UPI000213E1DB|nr:DUF937 domain-containing protein [Hyphomicrobium sp. MC1]CCB65882.1 conserved protein of unknown function [Hyphomicrobium sp. MC1]
MTIENSLRSAEGQQLISNVASAFGIDKQKAAEAVQLLTDELSARIQRAMLSRGGVADVVSLVTAPAAQRALTRPDALATSGVAADGDDILDVLIGSKHVSRGIAQRTARMTGLDPITVQKLLPVVANLMVGELQRQSGPAIAKVAGSLPGLGGAGGSPLPLPGDIFPPRGASSNSSSDDLPSGPTSGASRGPIDAGNPLPVPGDTIPGVGRRNRYPQPGKDDNPYSRLPDIVRRGGERVPGPDGGSLETVIRSILGNLLGSNSGVVGTMIKLFLVRWIVSLVRRFLAGAPSRR